MGRGCSLLPQHSPTDEPVLWYKAVDITRDRTGENAENRRSQSRILKRGGKPRNPLEAFQRGHYSHRRVRQSDSQGLEKDHQSPRPPGGQACTAEDSSANRLLWTSDQG